MIEIPNPKQDRSFNRVLYISLSVVVVLWLLNLVIVFAWDQISCWFPVSAAIEPGTLGDTFGAINALFSALAFALLIWTSMMQREELRQNTIILGLQQEEMTKQSNAMMDTLALQQKNSELLKDQLRLSVMPVIRPLIGNIISPKDVKDEFFVEIPFEVQGHPIWLEKASEQVRMLGKTYYFDVDSFYVLPGQKFKLHGRLNEYGVALGQIVFKDKIDSQYTIHFAILLEPNNHFQASLSDISYQPVKSPAPGKPKRK